MPTKREEALARFDEGFNCAQAVFSAYAPTLGIDCVTALRVSSGFGGGMGRLQSVCGVVSGAFMLIGSQHGKIVKNDNEAKERTYKLIQSFAARFEALHGSILCRDLLGCDLNTPEGMSAFKLNNLHTEKCRRYVHDACGIIEEMLFPQG